MIEWVFCSPDISQGGPKNVPVVKPKTKSVDKKKRFYNIDTYLLQVVAYQGGKKGPNPKGFQA